MTPAVAIDGGRLLARLEALGQVGDTGDGGNCRLALTDSDREGRDLVVTWMRDLGMEVRVDAVGNVVGRVDGREDLAPVMCGSHIDTVRTGGRYDGNLGVLAGLEVVEALARAGVRTRRPLEVAFFTDEEGARFPPDMLGSLVYVGGLPLEDALDIAAVIPTAGTESPLPTLGQELARIGYAGPWPCPGPVPYAFVELHVEQGPVLEAVGAQIGAVTGVQGISWTEYEFSGQSNHAGTTPMDLRVDAGVAVARVVVGLRDLTRDLGPDLVTTVGRLELHPNLVNVVPGRATFTVDIRHPDAATLAAARKQAQELVDAAAHAEGVTVRSRPLADFDPVVFDPRLVELVSATATRLGLAVRPIVSGAGHDAQMLARVCPTAMVFTPSVRGISHNPAEYTAPDDLTAGAQVLLDVVTTLAEERV